MGQIVEVHFFGKFSLEKGSIKLDEQSIHSKKLIRLLAYFLMNSDRMISGEELGEVLWGNGGSGNPLGALKNLVYRLRNTLKILGSENYILSYHGTYGWNPQIKVQIDMSDFRHYAKQARIRQDDIHEKIKKYETAVKILYEKLGIARSQKMEVLYEEILCMSSNFAHASMDEVYNDIQETEPEGAFFCEYTVFREIYRLEARRVLRSGIAEYVLLVTVEVRGREKEDDPIRIRYYKQRGMRRLQRILAKNLRLGDVVARYGDEQYIVMLPYCNYEDSQKVFQRILSNFNKSLYKQKFLLKAETREISAHYDLPLERKGGGYWEDVEKK